MKKIIAFALLLMLLAAASAEDFVPAELPDGWHFAGWIEGGLSFGVPVDTEIWKCEGEELAQGYIFFGMNDEYTIQLRAYQPWEMTYEDFKAMVENEPSAEVTLRQSGDTEILIYKNTAPGENTELVGIMAEGLDGKLYKLSIFTGTEGDFSAEAPVWEIADVIAGSFSIIDYSQLGIEGGQ